MESVLGDLRYALRTLARSPGFALVAVFTLMLGIGATCAIFSVVDSLLLRGLPLPDPGRVMYVHETNAAGKGINVSPINFRDLQQESRSFEALALVDDWSPTLTGAGEPTRIRAAQTTPDVFGVLGIRPLLGSGFPQGSEVDGTPLLAVVSYGFWQTRLGGDPAVIGRRIRLNSLPVEIVGVLPAGLRAPLDLAGEVWVNFQYTSGDSRTSRYLEAIGRLRKGVSLETARAEMRVIAGRLEQADPKELAGFSFAAEPLQTHMFGSTRRPLIVLLGAAALVLLIVCANLSNLLLARGAAREKEFAVRAALGAGRGRVARQLLVENGVIALAGGGLGLLLAAWGTDVLVRLGPEAVRQRDIALDGRIVAFAVGLSALAALLFGAAPALRAAALDLYAVLKEGGRGSSTRGGLRLRSVLIVLQLALALTLLAGAGLLVRSLARLQAVDAGIRPERVLTMAFNIPRARYSEPALQTALYDRLLAGVRSIPGVEDAGLTTVLPLSGNYDQVGLYVEGRTYARDNEAPNADRYQVTPGYFGAMGLTLRRGRLLEETDRAGATRVVLVDDVLSRQLWPGEDPLGKRIRMTSGEWMTLVGVVGHVKQYGLDAEGIGQMYMPLAQAPSRWVSLVVKARGDPLALAAPVRAAMGSIDPEQPVYDVYAMKQVVARSEAERRFALTLLGLFAAIAIAIAAFGLYGIVAYAVAQRSREFGIRMALGARPAAVLRLVVGQGLGLAAGGVALGLAGALAATRLLGGLLFGVSAGDPITFAATTLVLVVVALLASLVAARRATRVDPIIALRSE